MAEAVWRCLERGKALALNDRNDILGQKADGRYSIWIWEVEPDEFSKSMPSGIYAERKVSISLPENWSLDYFTSSKNDSRVLVGRVQKMANDGLNWGDQPRWKSSAAIGDRRPIMIVPIAISGDANQDGLISFADTIDATSSANPFRLWINDDDDSGDESGNDEPGQASSVNCGYLGLSEGADWRTLHGEGRVDETCDLIDFFQGYLDLKQLLTVLPPSASVKYRLKHEQDAPNFVDTKLTRAEATSYQATDKGVIFGKDMNDTAGEAETLDITAAGTEPSSQFIDLIQNNNEGVILIEGCKVTTKPLVLSVEKDGAVIAEVKLELSIDTVERMYRWVNLRGAAGNLISFYLPDDHATTYAWEFYNDQTMPEDGHGYSRGAPSVFGTQQTLWRQIGAGPSAIHVPPTDPFVTMPFVCRSWSKVVGAESRTSGVIQDSLDLSSETFSLPGSTGGFRDEHSGQFNRSIQVLRPFYDAHLRRLGMEPTR